MLAQKIPDGIVNGSFPPSCAVQTSKKSRFRPQSGIPADPKKKRFSAKDLDKINHYMEESLIPQDTGSKLTIFPWDEGIVLNRLNRTRKKGGHFEPIVIAEW